MNPQFRSEYFNIFNQVTFANPNPAANISKARLGGLAQHIQTVRNLNSVGGSERAARTWTPLFNLV